MLYDFYFNGIESSSSSLAWQPIKVPGQPQDSIPVVLAFGLGCPYSDFSFPGLRMHNCPAVISSLDFGTWFVFRGRFVSPKLNPNPQPGGPRTFCWRYYSLAASRLSWLSAGYSPFIISRNIAGFFMLALWVLVNIFPRHKYIPRTL